MTIHEFTCEICGLDCLTKTTEAEANRELLDSGISTDGATLLSVCDDCYQAVMGMARKMGLLE